MRGSSQPPRTNPSVGMHLRSLGRSTCEPRGPLLLFSESASRPLSAPTPPREQASRILEWLDLEHRRFRVRQPRPRRPARRHGTVPRRGRGEDPRPRLGSHGQPRRQPVLPRRAGEGRGDPEGAVGAHPARRAAGTADRAGLHDRRLRWTAERHRLHAFLVDRPRARQREHRPAPERQQRGWADRGGGL